MMATQAPPKISTKEEDSSNTLIATGPTKLSLIELEEKLKETTRPSTTSTTSVPKKSALLARVQAAQERARLAQEKQRQAQLEQERALQEEERILAELNEASGEAVPKTTEAREEENMIALKDPPLPPPPVEETLPYVAALQPPPETFEPSATAPSAPPITAEETDLLSLNPVPPPTEISTHQQFNEPPPSFEQFQAENKNDDIDDAAFQLDVDGNELTPEKRAEMIAEQEKLLRQIKEEQEANQRAIAALTAENESIAHRSSDVGITATGPGEEAAIAVARTGNSSNNVRTVEIAPNKRVALHGQDRTKAAIADGTAVLVQCLYCQNWMQVTPSATLMFCPVCQVVSPVEHQTSVMTTEEALQYSMDRKMAEKIQNEEWAEQGDRGGFFGNVFGSSSNAATGVISAQHSGLTNNPASAEKKKQSWSEYLSSLMPAAGTGTTSTENEDYKPRSAEIVVGRKSHPQQHVAKSRNASVYGNNDTEEIKFDGGEDDERSTLLPGLVGESKPLFSCVVESVSNILTGQGELPEGELHGVDTSSLLTVTQAGRSVKGDERGEYEKLNTN